MKIHTSSVGAVCGNESFPNINCTAKITHLPKRKTIAYISFECDTSNPRLSSINGSIWIEKSLATTALYLSSWKSRWTSTGLCINEESHSSNHNCCEMAPSILGHLKCIKHPQLFSNHGLILLLFAFNNSASNNFLHKNKVDYIRIIFHLQPLFVVREI